MGRGIRVGHNAVATLMHRGVEGSSGQPPASIAPRDANSRRPRRPSLRPLESRRPAPGGLIHSDHGTQFTSWAFTERAKLSGLVPSMGSIGDCFDNAVVESFWARMQVELLNRRRWRTRVELANAIFEHLEIFHNRQRRHSSLGMLTPIEFEKMHAYPVGKWHGVK